LGNGDGSFQAAVNFDAGTCPQSLIKDDFNGDGKSDLAAADVCDDNISILLGNGDGSFQSAVHYAVGSQPRSVTIGDFNGDGRIDLAVANTFSRNISVFMGNGDGSFQPALHYGVGSQPRSVAVGDFNGDGRTDLAVANAKNNNISILINNIPQLTVAKAGSGAGSISSSTSGIDCGADCSELFIQSIELILTATPDAGTLFAGWSGDCSDCGTNTNCRIAIDADKTCAAIFNLATPPNYYVLSVSKTGGGNGTITSTPAGLSCGSDCSETYSKTVRSINVTLKVKPDAYSTFLGWGGDCQARGTKSTCSVKMNSDKNVIASFGLPGISVLTDTCSFGDVDVKKSSTPVTFTINNKGTGNLKITKIKLSGPDYKMFKINGGKKTILPGGTYQFTIIFKPMSAGEKSATIQITSNDPATPTVDMRLIGNGKIWDGTRQIHSKQANGTLLPP